MKSISKSIAFRSLVVLCLSSSAALAQKSAIRDEFFWLGQMNKATTLINSEEGLLDKAMVPKIAAGLAKVLEDGAQPNARRPSTVISFEPLLIRAAGQDVTLLHAGRSSQDMHATYRAAILKDDLLTLADQLNQTSETLVKLAEMKRMLALAKQTLKEQNQWVLSKKNAIDNAAKDLDRDFAKLIKAP